MTSSLKQIGFGILTNVFHQHQYRKELCLDASFRKWHENLETREHTGTRVMTVQDIPSQNQAPLGRPSSTVVVCCLVAKLCPTLRTCVPYPAPLSMGFPRQEYWSRLPFPSPGEGSLVKDPCMHLLHWQKDSLTLCHLSGMQIRSVYSKLLVYVTVDRSVVSGRDTQVWFPVLTIWVLWANKLFFLSIRFLTCETGVVMVSNHIIMLRNNKYLKQNKNI